MQQHLELERLLALVANVQHSLEAILAQCNSVDKTELVRPCLLVLFRKVGGAKTKVKLDRVVAALGQGPRLGRRAAKVLPSGVTSETVLRKGASCVVFGRRAESLLQGVSTKLRTIRHVCINVPGRRWVHLL